jgi:hemolysin III
MPAGKVVRFPCMVALDQPMNPRAALTRIYTAHEERLDLVVHVLGILFAVNASAWLFWHVTGLPVAASVFVYCAGLLAMIVASAAYNLTPHTHTSKPVLRRIDHCAIFIMIAATYTPFAANRLSGPTAEIILGAVWLCATVGIALKIIAPHRFEVVSIGLYLVMGWMIVAVARPLAANMASIDFWLLMGGGIVYSVGVVFYLLDRIPYHKAIWHGFVLVAAIAHFAAVSLEFALTAPGA